MVPVYDVSTPKRERLSWLTALVHSYDREHDWENDDDPSAPREMLREVSSLADDLERALAPAPEQQASPPDPDLPF